MSNEDPDASKIIDLIDNKAQQLENYQTSQKQTTKTLIKQVAVVIRVRPPLYHEHGKELVVTGVEEELVARN